MAFMCSTVSNIYLSAAAIVPFIFRSECLSVCVCLCVCVQSFMCYGERERERERERGCVFMFCIHICIYKVMCICACAWEGTLRLFLSPSPSHGLRVHSECARQDPFLIGSKLSRRMPALLCESPHKETKTKTTWENRPQLASRLKWGWCDLCVCVSWGGGSRSFKSWLLRSTCKKREMDTSSLILLSPQRSFFNISMSSFAFKACCVSGHTVSRLRRAVPGCAFVFDPICFLSSRKHRENIAPVRGRGILVLCQSESLSPSLCFSFFSGFQSLPLPAIHRLHRPKLLDLLTLTTM